LATCGYFCTATDTAAAMSRPAMNPLRTGSGSRLRGPAVDLRPTWDVPGGLAPMLAGGQISVSPAQSSPAECSCRAEFGARAVTFGLLGAKARKGGPHDRPDCPTEVICRDQTGYSGGTLCSLG
jgi:hypothetical protein